MAGQAVLLTGAGGFIGRYILAHYLEETDADCYLVEHGRFCERLRAFIKTNVSSPKKRARAKIIEGDITFPGLHLNTSTIDEMRERVTHVLHLAALYNLSVPRDAAMLVNVEGTKNVLDFAQSCPNLKRFGHMSTTAVSGTCTGTFSEDNFNQGQEFKNFYEETKFLAERLVREYGLEMPVMIFRPTVVVGHSKTGAIEKIDGPYHALTMIARRMHLIAPNSKVLCHIAPVDFVADSIFALFQSEEVPNNTYQLSDPSPVTYNEFFNLACNAMGRVKPILRLSPEFMDSFARMGIVQRLTGVTYDAFLYSKLPIEYPAKRTWETLANLGIACPGIWEYIGVMVRYFREHYHDENIRRGDWRHATS